jgi:hypothetical protein
MSVFSPPSASTEPSVARPASSGVLESLTAFARSFAWPLAVYLCSRLLVFLLALVVAAATHHGLATLLTQYDGQWYLRVAAHGYPRTVLHEKSTLGFLPGYPLAIVGVSFVVGMSRALGSLVISFTGGCVSAVLVDRLVTRWWGAGRARLAVVFFCLFPGSIVFSMAYSEGLSIPLALGCLLALDGDHYLLAGLLAGLAGAIEPAALVLVPVVAFGAVRSFLRRRHGDPGAARSLFAPVLASLGIGSFAVFLWAWTGTPFAAIIVQHYGWHEQGQPLAVLALPLARRLLHHPGLLVSHLANWSLWNGILGGGFLVASLRELWRFRGDLPATALALVAGIGLVSVLSVMTPPNARMLFVAFPAVLVWARCLSGRALYAFGLLEAIFFIGASALTLSGHMLP